MYGNIKGPVAVIDVWRGGQTSSILTAKMDKPLVTIFTYDDCNFHQHFMSLPVHYYKHLDTKYLKEELKKFFPRKYDFYKYRDNTFKANINSIFVPDGISVKGYFDKSHELIKGPFRGDVKNKNKWTAMQVFKS